MVNVRTYNILLVGRTGNGKSSTRNSIIDREITEIRDSSTGLVDFTRELHTPQPGIEVRVIEGPGIGDTGADMTGSLESQLKLVKKGLQLCDFTVHAIVVVLKYGIRFTKQEKEAVAMIKSIFGGDALNKCGVVLMTCGDNFEMDIEDGDGMTFEKWCEEQSGDIQQLFEDCSGRYLLFNNRAKDKSKQRAKLLEIIIERIASPYNKKDYKAAKPGRLKLLLTAKAEDIEKKTDNFLKQVNDNLDKLDLSSKLDVRDLEKEEAEVESHLNELKVKDNGTGVLKSSMDKVTITKFRLQTLVKKASMNRPQEKMEERVRHRGNIADEDKEVGKMVSRKKNPAVAAKKKDERPFWILTLVSRWWKTGVVFAAGLGIGLLIWRKYELRQRPFVRLPRLSYR